MPESHPLAIVSASGGMDSTSLLLHLLAQGDEVQAVAFDYGQRHKIELQRLAANVAYLRNHLGPRITLRCVDIHEVGGLLQSALTTADATVPLGHYEDDSMRATFVPNRNAIFASILYGYALSLAMEAGKSVRIGLGVHAGDHAIYPDCRPQFHAQLFEAFRLGNWGSDAVSLYLPYVHWDKSQILRDAQRSCLQLKVDFDVVLRNTSTSYLPDAAGRPHGLTGSDVERILAFDQLGLQDPLEYSRPWAEVVAAARRTKER